MHNYDDLRKKLKNILGDVAFIKGEIKMLTDILYEEETVESGVFGTWQGHNALWVATNLRLIFLDRSLFDKSDHILNYKSINGIKSEKGLIFSKIIIYYNKHPVFSMEMENAQKKQARRFIDFALMKMDEAERKEAESPEPHSATSHDVIDKLNQLNELRKDGAISDEEYEKLKQDLL